MNETMRKTITLIVFMVLCAPFAAQTVVQQGMAYRYNGKNPRTPLPNVAIGCASATNTVLSDSTGAFTLSFNKLKMGDRLGTVTVKKREMIVFNQQAVDDWSVRNEPLCLILCDACEFEKQKQQLINIGRKQAEEKYNRQKAELEQQLASSQIDRDRYEAELDDAYKELEDLRQHIDEYADFFARIDQSVIDTTAQHASELLSQGRVQEAMTLYEQGNYLEKLKEINRALKQGEKLKEKTAQSIARAEEEQEKILQCLNTQIAAYKLQNEWEKAGQLLKDIADETEHHDDLYEYAQFCYSQNDFANAEHYYQKALSIIRPLAEEDPDTYGHDFTIFLNNLALIYLSTQRYEECEALHLESLAVSWELAKDHPDWYNYNVVLSLNNLANLYRITEKFDDCEELLREALDISREWTEKHPELYEPLLAGSLMNFGSLYYNTDRPEEGEKMYREAIEIRRRLAQDNPEEYERDLANTLASLASRLAVEERNNESEKLFIEAIDILRRLASTNPRAHEEKMALTLYQLSLQYWDEERYDECEELSWEALEIFDKWSATDPEFYGPAIVKLLFKLGTINFYRDDDEQSIPLLEAAVELSEEAILYDPDIQTLYELSLQMLSVLKPSQKE